MYEDNREKIIVHLWTAGPFMDESTYQETALANSNKKNHDKVYIVTTNMKYELDGSISLCEAGQYVNSHGVDIVRLNTHRRNLSSRRNFIMIYRELCRLQPDFIMNHVFNPTSCMAIHMYKMKNPSCKVVADSHMTRCNSYGEKLSLREIVICSIMKLTGLICYGDVDRFYGITDQTVDMMIKLYGVPKDKTETLYLGYDSDNIRFDNAEMLRERLRSERNISREKTVFVTGGKLSPIKKITELVKVFKNIKESVLIIFGDFCDDGYETAVRNEAGDNVFLVGALEPKQIYELFLASDIAVFPGSPSCLRQEAVACGLPIIMACNDEGDEKINILLNSNGIYLKKNWTDQELTDSLNEIRTHLTEYKSRAMELAQGDYLKYSNDKQADYILRNGE